MNSKIQLEEVEFIPKNLEPGKLYVSGQQNVAVHLCACGCDNKVTTPLGPAEWFFYTEIGNPSLYPSIANWHIPCRSHYWVKDGEVIWSSIPNEEQLKGMRKNNQERLKKYFKQKEPAKKKNLWERIYYWLLCLFK